MQKKSKKKPLPMVETVDTVNLPRKGVIKISPAKRPKTSKNEVFVPKSKDCRPKKAKMQAIRQKFLGKDKKAKKG